LNNDLREKRTKRGHLGNLSGKMRRGSFGPPGPGKESGKPVGKRLRSRPRGLKGSGLNHDPVVLV